MIDHGPWETEPRSLDFEADGLPCAMRRNHYGVWCGYVGVGPEHPLFGLPTNHLLKLPDSWFKGRMTDQSFGPMDMLLHAMSGKWKDDVYPISLAFEVHGGINFAEDTLSEREPGRWWFGFDCGHAGDHMPRAANMNKIMGEVIDSMPEQVRDTMRGIMAKQAAVYRDQQYVVGECQSLAAQLVAYAKLMEKVDVSAHDRRG